MAEQTLTERKLLSVLMVEDSPDDADLIALELRRNGFKVKSERVETRDTMSEALEDRDWDLVLTDHAMPSFSSMGVVELLREREVDLPCIIVSGAIGEEAAVTLMRSGAVDYVNKDKLGRLGQAVERALEEAETRRARREAEEALRRAHDELEQRVTERTAELSQANVRLQAEVLEREKTENALRESEERFSKAFHSSPVATMILRIADLHFVDANASFFKMSEYEPKEIEGRSLRELELLNEPTLASRIIERLKRDEGGFEVEMSLRTKSGQLKQVLAANDRIDLNGEPCMLAMLINITERKQTEQALMQAIQAVMKDATWFAQSVMDKLAQLNSSNPSDSSVSDLTSREREVIELIAKGWDNNRIAEELKVTNNTIRNYISRIYDKLEVHSRAEAIVWARERGLGSEE